MLFVLGLLFRVLEYSQAFSIEEANHKPQTINYKLIWLFMQLSNPKVTRLA